MLQDFQSFQNSVRYVDKISIGQKFDKNLVGNL